jgi:hypothetical protein
MARPCVVSLLTTGVDAKRQGIITGRASELLAGLTAGQRASRTPTGARESASS